MTAVVVCVCPFAWYALPEELARLVAIGEDDVYQLCHLKEAFTAGIGRRSAPELVRSIGSQTMRQAGKSARISRMRRCSWWSEAMSPILATCGGDCLRRARTASMRSAVSDCREAGEGYGILTGECRHEAIGAYA